MHLVSKDCDVSIIEIGGTVGDIEGQPFIEAMRQIIVRVWFDARSLHPPHARPLYPGCARIKNKTDSAFRKGAAFHGIQPNILCLRADRPVPQELREKIARTCNLPAPAVVNVADVEVVFTGFRSSCMSRTRWSYLRTT